MMASVTAFASFSVGPCESEHAKHRQAASCQDQSVSMGRLAATSCNRQLSERISHHRHLNVGDPRPALPDVSVPSNEAASSIHKYSRAFAASQLHHIDWVAEQRALNPSVDCFSTQAWADWRLAWQSLDDETRSIFTLEHDALKGIVQNRPAAIEDGRVSNVTSHPYPRLR